MPYLYTLRVAKEICSPCQGVSLPFWEATCEVRVRVSVSVG